MEFSELVIRCREIAPERMLDTDLEVLAEVQSRLLRLQRAYKDHPEELSELENQRLTMLPLLAEYLQ